MAPLKHWRDLHGYHQVELAQKLGVHRISINRLENYRRRPSNEIAEMIAALPGFPMSKQEVIDDYRRNVRSR